MAQKIELEIEIDPQGNVRIETHGLRGAECLAETAALERELGEVAAREKTRDSYAEPARVSSRSTQR